MKKEASLNTKVKYYVYNKIGLDRKGDLSAAQLHLNASLSQRNYYHSLSLCSFGLRCFSKCWYG